MIIALNQGKPKFKAETKEFFESTKLRESPLYMKFYNDNLKSLVTTCNRINTSYIDEEADSFAEGPLADIKDILSNPSPLNNQVHKIYLTKRELRQRNTIGLIQQFHSSSPLYRGEGGEV